MSELDAQLGIQIKELQDLRRKADYDETSASEFGGMSIVSDEVRQE